MRIAFDQSTAQQSVSLATQSGQELTDTISARKGQLASFDPQYKDDEVKAQYQDKEDQWHVDAQWVQQRVDAVMATMQRNIGIASNAQGQASAAVRAISA